MEFIQANLLEIIIVAVFAIIAILYVAWLIKKKGLRELAISLIVTAEDMFMKGQNTEKMDFAINKLIAAIPMPFKIFVTKDSIKKFIQGIFDEIKEALDYKK